MYRELIKITTGSHLYETNLPISDLDCKFVFQPSARSLLLQNSKDHIELSTKKSSEKRKNDQDDIDCEGFSVAQFLQFVISGQTIALELLFAPKQFYLIDPDPIWIEIINNRDKFLSKKMSAFVGYCRAQFSKYCLKASRFEAVRDVVEILSKANQHDRLEVLQKELEELKQKHDSAIQWEYDKNILMFACCGRKSLMTQQIDRAHFTYKKLLDEYGNRTKAIVDGNSIDWKALYHAVRVAYEAEELLLTGHITLPRPEVDLLMSIRNQEKSYEEISSLIEEGLVRVENAMKTSSLPEEPNRDYVNDLLFEFNYSEVINYKKEQ